jgi:predicted esterase
MIKQIFIFISSIIFLLIAKMIIYRKSMYIYPILKDADNYTDFLKSKKIVKFNLIDTLGWYIPGKQNNKIIVFCHGNSNNITWKKYILERLSNNFSCPIICIDYLRSPEQSLDNMITRTEKLVEDLFAKGFDINQIVLFGESLGCAIALSIAHKYKIPNIINYIGFRRISDIVKAKIPYLGTIVSNFIYELDNELLIKLNNFNLTLLNSRDDKLVDFRHIEELAKSTSTELLEIKGSHNKPEIPNHVLEKLKQKYGI